MVGNLNRVKNSRTKVYEGSYYGSSGRRLSHCAMEGTEGNYPTVLSVAASSFCRQNRQLTGLCPHLVKSILNLKQKIGFQYSDILCVGIRQKCRQLQKSPGQVSFFANSD